MPKLPTVTADQAIAVFAQFGFVKNRKKGSHWILAKPGHRFILSIPDHGKKDLKPGLLRSQIRTASLTVEDFVAMLGKI